MSSYEFLVFPGRGISTWEHRNTVVTDVAPGTEFGRSSFSRYLQEKPEHLRSGGQDFVSIHTYH